MTSRIRHITVDCRDAHSQALFWAAVLGFKAEPDDPSWLEADEALIIDPLRSHPGLLFQVVPEGKTVKNRLHLDLQPIADTRDVTVDKVLALGAAMVADHRTPDGMGWAVLTDPEGNEFCIERSAAERAELVTTVAPGWGARPMPEDRTADERTTLTAMLDWYREGVVDRVAGLGDEEAARRIVDSATTVIGLVKHLALVEDSWFHHRFAGNDEPEPWASAPWDDDRDWEFNSARGESLQANVDLYLEACARSRAVTAAAASLDDTNAIGSTPFTLRWMLLHLIEETARHLGHLDILREITDGRAGD